MAIMEQRIYSILTRAIACGLLFAACSPPKPSEPSPSTTPTPTPVPTPHPANGAKEAAINMYPDLGVAGSVFNKTFVDFYEDRLAHDPQFLTKPDWPIILAQQVAASLHVFVAQGPKSTPEPSWIDKRRQEDKSINAPAHDEKKNVTRRARIYYYTP